MRRLHFSIRPYLFLEYNVLKNSGIGGQAVIEGIMMRCGDRYSVGVRNENHEIQVKIEPWKSVIPIKNIGKIPVLRGVASFVDSLVIGTSALMWSAEIAGDEEETEEERREREAKAAAGGKEDDKAMKAMMTGTVVISILFSVGLFIILPYFLASILRRFGASEILVSLAEAVLRIAIFLIYMLLISQMKDIQRVFAYHGAEHKCINCIESGLPLTVDNVLASSRQHKRCGTSFMLVVVVISVFCFLIVGALGIRSPLARFASRIVLIPVIAGLSFEFLRLAAVSENKFVCTLARPGLALQKLVTREPDAEMAEVAIAAVEAVFDWRKWQEENDLA